MLRHPKVEHDDIGMQLASTLESLTPVRRMANDLDIRMGFECNLHPLAKECEVIGNQNPHAQGNRPHWGLAAGRCVTRP